MCVCVCVCEREREKERVCAYFERFASRLCSIPIDTHAASLVVCFFFSTLFTLDVLSLGQANRAFKKSRAFLPASLSLSLSLPSLLCPSRPFCGTTVAIVATVATSRYPSSLFLPKFLTTRRRLLVLVISDAWVPVDGWAVRCAPGGWRSGYISRYQPRPEGRSSSVSTWEALRYAVQYTVHECNFI